MKPSVCRQVMGAHQEQRTCQFISPVKLNIRFLPWACSLQLFNWKQEVTTVTQPVWNLPSWDASVEKKVKSKLQAVDKASRVFVESGWNEARVAQRSILTGLLHTGGGDKPLYLPLRREKVRFKENADAHGRGRVGCWFEPKQKCQPSFCFWRRADRGGRTRGNQPSKQALMKVGVTFPSKLNPPLTDQHPTSAVLQQRLVTVTMREIPQPLNKNRHCSGFTVK